MVVLAVDGAIDAVKFVEPDPGRGEHRRRVTDARTRSCLRLLALMRAALAVAIKDPPSPRYPSVQLPARKAANAPT